MISLDPQWVSPDTVWYRVDGAFDLASAAEVEMGISLLELQRPRKIVLDLRDVEMIDSAGLRVLVDAEARARGDGRSFAIAAEADGIVRRLLAYTALDMRIPVVETPSAGPNRGAADGAGVAESM